VKLNVRLQSGHMKPETLSRLIAQGNHPITFHIGADGEVITDLRDPLVIDRPSVSTDMSCANCDSTLFVEMVDPISRVAEMRCPDCGYHFHHRMERFQPRSRTPR
jgi:DNA-directed RNA polymerase subunit RPC12/RpoP